MRGLASVKSLVTRVTGFFRGSTPTAAVPEAPPPRPKSDFITLDLRAVIATSPPVHHGPTRAERIAEYQRLKAEAAERQAAVALEAGQQAAAQVAVGVGTLPPVTGTAIATATAAATPVWHLEEVLAASTLQVKPSDLTGRQKIEAEHLLDQFSRGNDNPGLGTRTIGKGICYLRGKHGVRLFYRMTADGPRWLAVSNKQDEDSTIGVLRQAHGL
jgi:hypothetical protein